MPKQKKTIGEIFDDGRSVRAAVRRAVREAARKSGRTPRSKAAGRPRAVRKRNAA